MNCENYQTLLSEFVDGTLTTEDCARVELHLTSCPECADARNDLRVIVDFCLEQRGQYDAVPNERALWLRISNLIEAEKSSSARSQAPPEAAWWFRLMNRNDNRIQRVSPFVNSFATGCRICSYIWRGVDRRSLSTAATDDRLLEPAGGIEQGALESADARNVRSKHECYRRRSHGFDEAIESEPA